MCVLDRPLSDQDLLEIKMDWNPHHTHKSVWNKVIHGQTESCPHVFLLLSSWRWKVHLHTNAAQRSQVELKEWESGKGWKKKTFHCITQIIMMLKLFIFWILSGSLQPIKIISVRPELLGRNQIIFILGLRENYITLALWDELNEEFISLCRARSQFSSSLHEAAKKSFFYLFHFKYLSLKNKEICVC